MLSSVALGWLGRRVLDWGGWVGGTLFTIIQFYNSLPPGVQMIIQQVAEKRWTEITLGSLFIFVPYVWSQVQSFMATVKPQVVTEEGKRVPTNKLPEPVKETIEAKVAPEARKRKTLADVVKGLVLGS